MPSPDWEDLDEFLQLDEFAVSVKFEPLNGVAYSVDAIFDYPAEDASAGEYTWDTRAPRLTCPSIDVKNVQRGDFVTVNGKKYDVLDGPQHDGTGIAVITLGEQA